MTLQPVAEDQAAQAVAANTLREVVCILADLADLQVRVSRLAKMLATTRVILPANDDVDDVLKAVADALNRQPASEETSCPQREPTALCGRGGILQESAGKEQRNTRGVTVGETTTECTSSSNRDVSADGEPSSGAVPQDEAPQAGTGSEMLADREGHDPKGAGEDEASAMDRRSDPAPTIPLKRYVPQSPACQAVLDLYGETTLKHYEIARRLNVPRPTATAYLSMGRKAGDPRVLRGDTARRSGAPAAAGEQGEGQEPAEIVETVVVVVEEPSELAPIPNMVFRRPPKIKDDEDDGPARLRLPSAPPAPIKLSPPIESPKPVGAPVPRADFDPSKIIVVDVESLRAYGPCGDIQVARPFAHALSRMDDGGSYGVEQLRDLGPWPSVDAMKQHFSLMRPKLAGIGVDLVTVNKFMYRVQRLGA